MAGRAHGGDGVRRPVGHCGLPQVLDTYMFHSFLKARLSRRRDAFAQMELITQPEEDRCAGGAGGSGPRAARGQVNGTDKR